MCLLVSLSEGSRIQILVLGTFLVCGLQPHEETFHPPSSVYTPIGSVRRAKARLANLWMAVCSPSNNSQIY